MSVAEICASLGWEPTLGYSGSYKAGIWTIELSDLEYMSGSVPLEEIPLRLASGMDDRYLNASFDKDWMRGIMGDSLFRRLVTPYLSKRLELET